MQQTHTFVSERFKAWAKSFLRLWLALTSHNLKATFDMSFKSANDSHKSANVSFHVKSQHEGSCVIPFHHLLPTYNLLLCLQTRESLMFAAAVSNMKWCVRVCVRARVCVPVLRSCLHLYFNMISAATLTPNSCLVACSHLPSGSDSDYKSSFS